MALTTKEAQTEAMTRAAFVDLPPLAERHVVSELLDKLCSLQYNTFLLPVLHEGRFYAEMRGDKLRGTVIRAADEALKHTDKSVWLYIDPMAAGPVGSGDLGLFARQHREWLIRNTEGHIRNVGKECQDPLFSWMNLDYRRFLGDMLVAMAEALPVCAIVLDMRRYPGTSSEAASWYCCSYQSQVRAEEALELDFEKLLAEGTKEDINAWQTWVLGELRQFLEYLTARVRNARRDISWRLLAPDVEDFSMESAPWMTCFAEGLADELILVDSTDPDKSFARRMEIYDRHFGRRLLIMPAYDDMDILTERSEEIAKLPCTGFLALKPSYKNEVRTGENVLRWHLGGALEDSSLSAVKMLARYLKEEFNKDSPLRKFYAEIADDLDNIDATPRCLASMMQRLEVIETGYMATGYEIRTGEEHLLREADLLSRLLGAVKPEAILY